jgi:predicted RecA/RadA family phage recombinase
VVDGAASAVAAAEGASAGDCVNIKMSRVHALPKTLAQAARAINDRLLNIASSPVPQWATLH